MKPSEPIEIPPSKSAWKQTRKFTQFGFWLRVVIYNCVLGAVLLPIYNIDRVDSLAVTVFKFFSPPCTPHQTFAKSEFDFISTLYTCQDPQSEGISTIGALARAQGVYYANHLKFSDSIEALQTGLPLETNHYQFQMWTRPKNGPFDRGTGSPEVIVTAIAKQPKIRSYGGAVFIDKNERLVSQMCETRKPSQDFPISEMMSDLKTIQCRDLYKTNAKTIQEIQNLSD